MDKNTKYSKEIKIKACKDYENGYGSLRDIAKSIGAGKSVVHRWYLRYTAHGFSVFDTPNNKRSYSKKFKLSVIKEYSLGKDSMTSLSAKYNISEGRVCDWINKWYNGIEIRDYDPKGDVYTMKSRKTTFEERLEIVKWVIENDMSYRYASDKYSITYALIYKWTKAYIEKGPEALRYQKRGPKAKSEIEQSNLSEIDTLKLELEREKLLRKRREFELEVLKKKEEFEKRLHSQK